MTTTLVLAGLLVAFWGGFYFGQKDRHPKCGHDGCDGRTDPRCGGGNCTYHCAAMSGCHGRCLDAWAKSEAAYDAAVQILEKTRGRV